MASCEGAALLEAAMSDRVVRVITVALSIAFLAAGGIKVFVQPEVAAEQFAHFGYASWFATFIGCCEMAGAAGLQIRRLSSLAALGLACIMAGAVVSHLTHDPAPKAAPAFVLLVLCLLVSRERWNDLVGGGAARGEASA